MIDIASFYFLSVDLREAVRVKYNPQKGEKVTLFVIDNQTNKQVAKLVAEQQKDGTPFFIARILASLFKEETLEIPQTPLLQGSRLKANVNSLQQKTYRLGYQYSMDNTPTILPQVYYALNSAKKSYKENIDGLMVLTPDFEVTKYEGYPREISILCATKNFAGAENSYLTLNNGSAKFGKATVDVLNKDLNTNIGVNRDKRIRFGTEEVTWAGIVNLELTDEREQITFRGGNSTTRIEIKLCNKDCLVRPYYVRFLQRDAGWGYVMFQYNQKYEWSKQNASRVEVYKEDGYSSEETELKGEYERKITVGKEDLNASDFENLMQMVKSKHIFHYNEKTNNWERIFIDNDKWATHRKNTKHSFECSFVENWRA